MNLFPILGAAGVDTAATGMPFYVIVIYLLFFGGVFYFLLIRPQKKQQKKQDAMLSQLATGDSILTTSGFYGVVIDVMDEVVIVEFGNNKNCRIPMKKQAIVEIEKPSEE